MNTSRNAPSRPAVLGVACTAALVALTACSSGGGGGGGGTPPTQFGLGMNSGTFAEYAQDKGRGNFANFFGSGSLPARVDLRDQGWVPPIGNQGGQGSCVGWASAYGMKTVQEANEESWAPNDPARQFSPSFVFNQIAAPGGQGSQPSDAVELLVKKGCATLATMPYDENDYQTLPTNAALEEAAGYRASRAVQVQLNEASMKAALASGNPLVVGVQLYEPFQQAIGSSGWRFGPEHVTGQYIGGHAMCVIGYDDAQGVFITLNSWGPGWGDNGFCYLDYRLLTTPFPADTQWSVLAMAYTVEDMPNAGRVQQEFPTNLRATTDNPNFVALNWNAAASVQGYRVERSANGQNWVTVAENVRETSVNDAPPDFATYSYRVLGIKGVDRTTGQETLTQPSNEVQGNRSQGGGGGGTAPTGVQASIDLPLTIDIQWDALPGAEFYLVVRSENDNTGPYDIVDYTPVTSTYDIPPTQGRPFYYRVSAILANGPTDFSTAAEGRTGTAAALDLSADDMFYPFDFGTGEPLDMVPGNQYEWPYWVSTNWSPSAIDPNNHVILVGLFRPAAQGFESYVVAGWFIDDGQGSGFPADTTIVAEDLPLVKAGQGGQLVPAFDGFDLFTGEPIPRGVYYWFLGSYLLDANGEVVEDADQSDNEFYLLDPVRVFDNR